MKHVMKHAPCFVAAVALVLAAGVVAPGHAGTLENMERERAILLDALLTAELPPEQRQGRVEVARNRLIDLERMVLRDRTLVGKSTPAVRAAWENYDLTFLVHASVEHNRGLLDHWLQQVGVSTESLMNARVGRR
jgi:hypothetical protein